MFSAKKTIIDGWDCTLVTDKSKTPFLINKQPLVDLMAGFFTYFASFDFANKVGYGSLDFQVIG